MKPRWSSFSWWWVAAALTGCGVVGTAELIVAWDQVTGGGHPWWDLYFPGQGGVQFLGNEQFLRMRTLRRVRFVPPATALAGLGLCAWAWRRARL